MAARTRSLQLTEVPADRLAEAVNTLVAAFSHYPMTTYFLEGAGLPVEEGLRRVFELSCRLRLAMDWPLPGVIDSGEVVAVACVTGIGQRPEPPELLAAEKELAQQLGKQAVARMETYGQAKQRHQPGWPHLYLTAVGVRPDRQGRGFGRMLIEHVHQVSRDHPSSRGVALDTQSPTNVPIYEHLGYQVHAEESIGPVASWFMNRPDVQAC